MNVTAKVISLQVMKAFGSISENEYTTKIEQLCATYGTEVIAQAMVIKSHDTKKTFDK